MNTTNEWKNFGDVNFIEYGGCLVKADSHPNCYHVLTLITEIPDYVGKYKKPMIVARCFIDLDCWLDNQTLFEINQFTGASCDYIPKTEEELILYCTDLINYYGIREFDPDFPKETGCGCYALGNINKWIVGKQIAQKFMKECEVPKEFRE